MKTVDDLSFVVVDIETIREEADDLIDYFKANQIDTKEACVILHYLIAKLAANGVQVDLDMLRKVMGVNFNGSK